MNWRTLAIRSLGFYGRSHLGTFLGSVVGSAVLVGALVVGDSVRGSLREMAMERVGRAALAMASGDRLFREVLREDFGRERGGTNSADLMVLGTAALGDGTARANQVQVIGVDSNFWKLALEPLGNGEIAEDGVVLNEALARQLRARKGDFIVLRVERPSLLSRDAPLSPEENSAVALRLRVDAVAPDAAYGRFSLQASQVPPFNAFVRLKVLQDRMAIGARANLLLCSDGDGGKGEGAAEALQRSWQLADAELEVRTIEASRQVELRSKRVFLDAPVVRAAGAVLTNGSGILTYFVNELRVDGRAAPYSMVTAMGSPVVPPDMGENEILISRWLAEDLQAKQGDRLRLTYYVVGNQRRLEEKSAEFAVRGIVAMEGAAADPGLMPDFPGMADAKNCREWDTGFAIDLDKIREKDNRYWQEHRGTPKAFVTLAAGQRLWTNRFGTLTAVRWGIGPGESLKERAGRLEEQLRKALNPGSVGLNFAAIRAQALAASAESQDFGGLFVGFSLFLVVAALLLMGLLFQFGMERRSEEVGILLALGLTPRQVRKLFFLEGSLVAAAGTAAGVLGGIGYAHAMLRALSTVWVAAIGTSALRYHATAETLASGAAASMLVGAATVWLVLRKQARQAPRELLADAGTETVSAMESGRKNWPLWTAIGAGVAALGTLGYALADSAEATADTFFSAGTLLLVAGMAGCAVLLRALARRSSGRLTHLAGLGLRNAARRRRRSLATIALLACGSFLIASIGAFHLGTEGAEKRESGTGGFALMAESSMAVVEDLNSEKGREALGLDGKELNGVKVVPLRVHAGEDASCLNLNRAQKPRLLGVDPRLLDSRGAFTFVKTAPGLPKDHGWLLLESGGADEVVPAIGDAASIQWALGKKVGDTLDYVDEHGHGFKVRLVGAVANSILQGSLIIAESAFTRRYPSESGYRMFLVDAPSKQSERVRGELTRALRDWGLQVVGAAEQLAKYNAVQNTYLSTFQALGGLGLVLGSFGLGVVVLRNVLERRGELALLLAVGFRRRSVRWLVVSEHAALLILGLLVGVGAGLAAVLPQLISPAAHLPYAGLGATLGAVLVSGLIWTWLSAASALKGNLVAGLRNE